MSAGFAGRHVVGAGDLSVDVFLDVQNQRYCQILYLLAILRMGFIYDIKSKSGKSDQILTIYVKNH